MRRKGEIKHRDLKVQLTSFCNMKDGCTSRNVESFNQEKRSVALFWPCWVGNIRPHHDINWKELNWEQKGFFSTTEELHNIRIYIAFLHPTSSPALPQQSSLVLGLHSLNKNNISEHSREIHQCFIAPSWYDIQKQRKIWCWMRPDSYSGSIKVKNTGRRTIVIFFCHSLLWCRW